MKAAIAEWLRLWILTEGWSGQKCHSSTTSCKMWPQSPWLCQGRGWCYPTHECGGENHATDEPYYIAATTQPGSQDVCFPNHECLAYKPRPELRLHPSYCCWISAPDCARGGAGISQSFSLKVWGSSSGQRNLDFLESLCTTPACDRQWEDGTPTTAPIFQNFALLNPALTAWLFPRFLWHLLTTTGIERPRLRGKLCQRSEDLESCQSI